MYMYMYLHVHISSRSFFSFSFFFSLSFSFSSLCLEKNTDIWMDRPLTHELSQNAVLMTVPSSGLEIDRETHGQSCLEYASF